MTELAALNVRITGDSGDLQADLNAARKSLNTFEAQAQKGARSTTALTGSFGRLSNMSGQTKAQLQNVGFQLQDIAVQLQGGTRASVVFAQQGSQLLSIFGPMGALFGTLAAVGIPALAFAFSKMGDETEDLADSLDAIEDHVDAVSRAFKVLQMDAEELQEAFGGLGMAARQASLAIIENEIELARRDLANLSAQLGDTANEYAILGKKSAQRNLEIRRELGLTVDEHVQLTKAIKTLQEAQGMRAQVEGAQDLRALMEQLGLDTSALSDEFLIAESNLNQAQLTAVEFEQKLKDAEVAAKNMNAELANMPMTFGDPRALAGLTKAQLLPDEPRGDTDGRKGRNPLKAQLEAVRNALMTQEEAQIASFERQQETLRSALEQQLLTRQEYNALMEDAQKQHADKLAQIDAYRYGDTLDKTGAFLGDMAEIMANGNEKMLRISKAFGAAQALISTYQGAAKELEKGIFGFATAAALIAKGLGFVSAIQGVNKGGTTSGGGAGGVAAPGVAGATAQAAPTVSRNVAISLTGGDMFSRDQVRSLINSINEAVEDGAIVRLV